MLLNKILYTVIIIALTSGCHSFDSINQSSNDHTRNAPGGSLQIAPPRPSKNKEKKFIPEEEWIQKVVFLEKEVIELKSQIEALKKGFRSGLLDNPEAITEEDMSPSEEVSLLPAISVASEEKDEYVGQSEEFISDVDRSLKAIKDKRRYGRHGDAIVLISEFQDRYPNYQDDGQLTMWLADSWKQVEQYHQALSVLRSFYFKYPESQFALQAKLIEADSYASIHSKQQAINVYKEIITLKPHSEEADIARARLEELRKSL